MEESYVTIINKNDYSEKVSYSFKDYPFFIENGVLSQYPNYSAITHWHEDLEFIVILSGHMIFNVNGILISLTPGNGIMINSRQFHHGYSDDLTECIFICIRLHPLLLCINELYERNYVIPIITNTEHPYQLLDQNVPWQNQIIAFIRNMQKKEEQTDAILEIQPMIFSLWTLLYQNFPKQERTHTHTNRQLGTVKKMLSYIQAHYKETISLNQIAAAGNICKSSCSALFQKYLQQTPVTYLTEYRLNKSIDLLLDSDLSITEVSFEVGFGNPSYYSETFRKYFNCTPREYMKKTKLS